MQSSPGRPEDTRGEPEGGRRRLQQTALPCITPEEGEPGRGDSTGKGPGGSLLGMLMVRQERNKPGGETGCGVSHRRPKMQHVTSQEDRDFGLLLKGR